MRLDDPAAIFVGELTDCCQAIGNAGESCMIHSVTSQNGRVLVVKDTKGKVVSQSWIWRNRDVLCFDNVEAVERDSKHKRIVSNEILNTISDSRTQFILYEDIDAQSTQKVKDSYPTIALYSDGDDLKKESQK